MFEMIFGLISGALGALSTFGNAMTQANNQRQQAAYMRAQAAAARRNASMEEERGRQEAYNQDRQKSRLRREYNNTQAWNAVSLASGNVDMTSGSALDVALGNINNFASDMGDNAYATAMAKWQASENAKTQRYQADALDANASYLNRTAGNLGTSLLTAGIAGIGGFTQGFTLAGGSLKGLFGQTTNAAGKQFGIAWNTPSYALKYGK